ncbi:hypothetical protein Daus18300_009030 [Diaporthe australafricana]|uniref:Uncharacterized protein n=1 Tax=Diaporthe australafricana TaxID=127596 RepID=A0ABR3WFQ8_9PEZI
MRLSQLSILLASGSVSIPEAHDAATQLGSIVAPRDLTCKATDPQCISCPKSTVKKGKCPKGAKCTEKRLDARDAEVGMDSIGEGEWGPGELIETPGLSFCSVMAVYDQNKWVMAHIPPGRMSTKQGETKPSLVATGEDVIREYTAKMTTKFNSAQMTGARGYLLMSEAMGADEQQLMRQWFQSVHITPEVKVYNYQRDTVKGSGNFVIARNEAAWPPSISFM